MKTNRIIWTNSDVQPNPNTYIDTAQSLLILVSGANGVSISVYGQMLDSETGNIIPFQENAVCGLTGATLVIPVVQGFLHSLLITTTGTTSFPHATVFVIQGTAIAPPQYVKFLGSGFIPFAFPSVETFPKSVLSIVNNPGAGNNYSQQFTRTGIEIRPLSLYFILINSAAAANRFLTAHFQSGTQSLTSVPSLAVTTASQTTSFVFALNAEEKFWFNGSQNQQIMRLPEMRLRELSGFPISITSQIENLQGGDNLITCILDYEEY